VLFPTRDHSFQWNIPADDAAMQQNNTRTTLIHLFVIRIEEDECMKREGIIFLSVISHVMPLLDD